METFDSTIQRIFAMPFTEKLQILDALRQRPDRVTVLKGEHADSYREFIESIHEEYIDKDASAFWQVNQDALKAALSEHIIAELLQRELPYYRTA
jgi:hypothetical protein